MKKLLLLILMLFSSSIQSQEVGLVADFPFNNSVSSSLNGEFFGNNLSTFTYVADRNAVTSQALSRSSSYTSAYFPNSNLPSGTSARTVSIWFKKSGSPGGVGLFEYGDGSSLSGFAIGFENIPFSNTSSLYFGAVSNYQNTTYTITDNVWYHYVVTTNPSGTVQQYVNGVSIGSFSFAINTNVTQFCTLGGNFNGAVDDLKIYNRELSAAEVLNLYTNNTSELTTVSAPTVNITSVIPSINTTQVNYTINANNGNTSSVINYGLTSGALSNQVGIWYSNGNTAFSYPLTLTGLAPNTLYYYQVEATNSAGTTYSPIQSFTTLANSSTPIAEYLFNNTMSNVNGTEPFSPSGTSFANDRFGTANRALLINGGLPAAPISNLPSGQASRTVSVWIRPAQVNADNIIFSYGSGSGNYVYGASFSPTIMYNFSYSSNLAYSTATTVNNWKHMVYTFDITTSTARIYINSVLVNSGTFPNWNTTSSSNFYLGNLFGNGSSSFNGLMDDLKIYDRALSDSEILSLFNNNTLSSSDFNQNNLQVSLYPNPANNVLNIEMTNDVKSIEIFNIQGQKVKSSNQMQINVYDLASGIYMIRIQDAENAIATKKFVKQ